MDIREQIIKENIKKVIEESVPIHKYLGLQTIEISTGFIKVRVPFSENVIGNKKKRRWHGGIIATVMDALGGMVGGTHYTSPDDSIATIDLRIDYLKGAEASSIIVEAKEVRLGNRILVVKMKAFQEDSNMLIAEGKGVYNFIRNNPDESK